MASINISLTELETLISFFNKTTEDLTVLYGTISTRLNEMQDSWQSTGQRGATFQEASGDYQQGFGKLVTATQDVLAFLNNSLQAYSQADS